MECPDLGWYLPPGCTPEMVDERMEPWAPLSYDSEGDEHWREDDL